MHQNHKYCSVQILLFNCYFVLMFTTYVLHLRLLARIIRNIFYLFHVKKKKNSLNFLILICIFKIQYELNSFIY